MGNLGVLAMYLKLNIDNFASQLKTVEDSVKATQEKFSGFKSVGDSLDSVGKSLTLGVTTPIVGAGTAAVKFATDMETSMAKVGTISDSSQMSIDDIRKALIDMSNQSGESTDILSEGLYDALSSGVQTKDAMDFLNVAVKDAKGGFTDTATAVDGLTSVLNGYGLQASDATKISNEMMVAQNLGKTTFGEMASVMGNVVPTANALKVKSDELFSSMAVLTANGIKTSESVTGLKAAFSNIVKPSKEASDAANTLGIKFTASEVASKGWKGFLMEIKDKLTQVAPEYMKLVQRQNELKTSMTELEKGGKKNTDQYKQMAAEYKEVTGQANSLATASDSQISSFATMFGSVEGLNTVLTLTSDQGMALYDESMKQMGGTTDYVQDAFDKMNNTSAANFAKVKENFKNTLTEVGVQILPTVTKILQGIKSMIDGFNSLSPSAKSAILTIAGIAATVGPVLLVVGKLCTAISSIGTAINQVKGVWGVLKGLNIVQKVTGVGTSIKTVGTIISTTHSQVSSTVIKGISSIGPLITGLGNTVKSLGSGVVTLVVSGISKVGTAFTALRSVLNLTSIVGFITSPAGLIVAGLAGIVTAGVLVYKNWDTIKEKATEAGEYIKQSWNGTVDKVKEYFSGVAQTAKDNWATLKQETSEKWDSAKQYVSDNASKIYDDAKKSFDDTVSNASTNWENLKKYTNEKWEQTKNFAKEHAVGIGTVIAGPIGTVVGTIITNWDSIKKYTSEKWKDAKDSVLSSIQDTGNGIPGKIGSIKTNFLAGINFLSTLGTDAKKWAGDMIDGFINGIKNGINKVGEAAKSIANKVKSYIHFSRPDEGPLAEYEDWMPDMIDGLVLGIQSNSYKISDTMRNLASSMDISDKLVVRPSVTPSVQGNIPSSQNGGYTNNAPIMQVDKLYVNDKNDIDNISRSIYNENMKVIRALGKR